MCMADEQVKGLAPEAREAIDSYLSKKITCYATIFGIVNLLAQDLRSPRKRINEKS